MTYRPHGGVLTLRWADETLALVDELGLAVPSAVTKADHARAALRDMATAPHPPRPPLPTDPTRLAATITRHATDRHTADTSRALAGEYGTDAAARYVTAVAAAVPDWTTTLATMHADALATLTDAAPHLPDTVTDSTLGRLSVSQFSHWQDAARAAHTLERIVAARTAMDRAAQQPAGGAFGRLALTAELTADPPTDRTVRTAWQWIAWASREWSGRTGATAVPRWRALLEATEHVPELSLTLAPHGTTRARALRIEAWRDRALALPILAAGYAP